MGAITLTFVFSILFVLHVRHTFPPHSMLLSLEAELTKTREVCLALSKLNRASPRTATRGFVVRRR